MAIVSTGTTTQESLEAMTDRSAFEQLALRVIRHVDVRYSALIATGTNAQGETIRSPVDGFCWIPGSSPPQYVFLESTTTDAEGLEKKWLHDHTKVKPRTGNTQAKRPPSPADDGDLLKAAREAAALKPAIPNAVCTVVLATNQRVTLDLMKEVSTQAASMHLSVDFLDISRIADFLDTSSTGQYLRWLYFRRAAERLSIELLMDIGHRSCAQYATLATIPSQPSDWVARHDEEDILRRLSSQERCMHLLVGESGCGKTVTAQRVMHRWLENGGAALWLSEVTVVGTASLYEAIDRVLRQEVPTLVENAIRVLAEVLGRTPLLLVVDDLNRASRASLSLRELAQRVASTMSELRVAVLCPVWPRVAGAAQMRDFEHVSELVLDRFLHEEAVAALGNGPDSDRVAEQLACDPLAIGLFREACTAQGEPTSARAVISTYVDRQLRAVQDAPGAKCLRAEHERAVSELAVKSLEQRTLSPPFEQVKAWFTGANTLDAIREVLQYSALIWVDDHDQCVRYRHDRFRDELFVRAMQIIAQRREGRDAFFDPFFAEIAAAALVRLEAPSTMLDELNRAPLVLAASLGLSTHGADSEKRITGALHSWLHDNGTVPITFTYDDPSANSVSISGTFNRWGKPNEDARSAERSVAGRAWRAVIDLPAGRHLYKFIVDACRWIHDPANPTAEPDGYGGFNSVLELRTGDTQQSLLNSVHARAILAELATMNSRAVLEVTKELPETFDTMLARFGNGDILAGI